MSNSILVVGGGFSGISAAVEAAELGYKVFLVEKQSYLGGRVVQLNQYYPKLCPPLCGLEIQFQRIRNNPNIKFWTLAEVENITGTAGNYDVTIKLYPRYININCTACGACEKICETEMFCEFNVGLSKRKAIYRPHIFSFPMQYVLDKDKCSAKELVAIYQSCRYDAVDLNEEPKNFKLKVGAIVYATGWKPYDVINLTNLGAGNIPNCITNMQMERLCAPNGPTNGQLLRLDNGAPVKNVAFVQCAGSRDQNHLNFCSYICCMASIKQTIYVLERYPKANVTIYYIDLRTPGHYDKFTYKVTGNYNVRLVKGKVAGIEVGLGGDVLVEVENTITGIKSKNRHDLVVLATGMEPSVIGSHLPKAVSIDEDGFVISDGNGIFAAGCAKYPLDVMRSAQSAIGSALKAIQAVVRR
ncbi:quinone-modifying oxidoreductase, subunit QmoA [Desulfovibrionales bacterium]